MTPAILLDCECACLPASAMGRLATLRGQPGVEIALHERNLWVRWPAGNDDVATTLMTVDRCRMFARREGRWVEWGRALPAFDVPDNRRWQLVDQVIFPAAVEPIAAAEFAVEAVGLRLVADTAPRPTRAVAYALAPFLDWAVNVPPVALQRLRSAANGNRLFVLGKQLPWIAGGERFWGRTVLVPLGFRVEPALPEEWLRSALGINASDLLVVRSDAVEIIAENHFTPMTLAALRIAAQEAIR